MSRKRTLIAAESIDGIPLQCLQFIKIYSDLLFVFEIVNNPKLASKFNVSKRGWFGLGT